MKKMRQLFAFIMAGALLLCPITAKAATEDVDVLQSNEEIKEVLPVLDVVKYKEAYPDLEKVYGDNWKAYIRHYFTFGIKEGRENFTDFDAKTYLSMYPDLQIAFGDDLVLATKHYLTFGIEEGRVYRLPESKVQEDSTVYVLAYLETLRFAEEGKVNLEENFTGEKTTDFDDGTYVVTTYVDGVLTSDKYYDEDGKLESQYEYDANGNTIKQLYYEDGKLITTYLSIYNSKNQEIQFEICDTMFEYINRFVYDYDEEGNLIAQKEYHVYEDYEEYVSREVYTYHEDGSLKTGVVYHSDGRLRRFTEIDEEGRIKDTQYHADGVTPNVIVEYDKDGTILLEEIYDEAGNLIE